MRSRIVQKKTHLQPAGKLPSEHLPTKPLVKAIQSSNWFQTMALHPTVQEAALAGHIALALLRGTTETEFRSALHAES